MKKSIKIVALLAAITFLGTLSSCQVIQDIFRTVQNVKRLQFKIKGVDDFDISGIKISSKSTLSNFATSDITKFATMVISGKFPVEFTLNVEARNPKDNNTTSQRTQTSLSSFPWKLYLNDVPTISGNINKSIYVPATGESVNIPIRMKVDFLQFFKDKGYAELVSLALSIGGVNGTSSNIKLKATPTISTSFGDIKYPGELTIMNKEWTN